MGSGVASRAWGLSSLLLALAWGAWVTLLVWRYDFWAFELLNRENGPVETTSALAFLAACLAMLSLAWRRWRAALPALGPLALALFLFVCLGEETSWGLQLLRFQAPAAFARYNVQRETNLHNLVWVESWVTLAYRLLFFGFFLALPLALRVSPRSSGLWRRFGLGPPPLGLGLLALAGATQLLALSRVPFPDSPLRHWLGEIGETGTALVWLLYAARERLGERAPWLLVPAALAFALLFLRDPYVLLRGSSGAAWPSHVEQAADGALAVEQRGVRLHGTTRGAPLGEGAVVRTAGEARLELLSSCQLRLRPGSELRLATLRADPARSEAQLGLVLEQGELWLHAAPLARTLRLELQTPAVVVESGAASFGVALEPPRGARIRAGLGPLTLRPRGTAPAPAEPLTLADGEEAWCREAGCARMVPAGWAPQEAVREGAGDWLFAVSLLKREFTRHSQLLIQLERDAGLPRGSVADRRARPGRTLVEDGSLLASLDHAPWPGGGVPPAERESLDLLRRLDAHVARLGARAGPGPAAEPAGAVR